MALNPYIASERLTQGSTNEEQLLAELIEESIQAWGQEFFYIPRTLVAKDDILGEDRLSKFQEAYPIEMYVETPQGFMGQGEFVSKFGMFFEQSVQVTVSRKRWKQIVGRFGRSVLPERPAEGDLLYYPITKRLFEIKYAEKDTGFYQLGNLQTYKLTIEMFQYSSERIETSYSEINDFESLNTFDENQNEVDDPMSYGDNSKFQDEASTKVNWDESNPFGEV